MICSEYNGLFYPKCNAWSALNLVPFLAGPLIFSSTFLLQQFFIQQLCFLPQTGFKFIKPFW